MPADGMAPDQTQRFEELLDRCERLRFRGVPFDELRELARLYRLHTTRLARQRARGDDPDVIRHLNALCVRAYTFLYNRPGATPRGQPLLQQVAEALGQTWRAQALAWILLAAGLLVGGVLADRDPGARHVLVPASIGYSPDMLDRLAASPAARAEFLAARGTHPAFGALFGSYLFVHNTRVGLLAFATGMLLGIPTVLLQLYNGMMLGAFASLFLRDHSAVPFLAWILPHGVPELTAISLCAAGGLVLGAAIAAPGRRGRQAALRAAVRPAMLLLVCALPLFALAALLEGFVRESSLGTEARLAVAVILTAAVVLGLVLTRRLSRQSDIDTDWLRALGPADRGLVGSSGAGGSGVEGDLPANSFSRARNRTRNRF